MEMGDGFSVAKATVESLTALPPSIPYASFASCLPPLPPSVLASEEDVVFDQTYLLSSADWRHQVENVSGVNSQLGSAESLTCEMAN